ncbi:tRNA uracil 4-sulfurtransferase ThiI [Bacillus sp. 03113]|uniref:tRNA uracil 4-sulfurtransferase ThiI n=1 Tax=Bacillus sp. 03113 TaxID=2578211 RepID=UPI0011427C8E|nr:tRNA uracil 4-sulfurtransferase ThiI [Bacillus sp. 03113]
MYYDRILVRYGEISTKGRNRSKFVGKLKNSIKKALIDFPKIMINAERDRMFILLNGENGNEVIDLLKGIFGIQSFSPVIKTAKDVEEMKNSALELLKEKYQEGKTFKVSAKRADKSFSLDTHEINYTLGSHLLKNIPGLIVNVKNPDINLQVEVRSEAVYISCETIKGKGGLPVGSSGKAMLMLSGGIDSPVAGYLSMKRGLDIEAVHFHSPPYTSERAKQKVIDLAEKLSCINGQIILHIVPFTEIQQFILQQVPENYTMTTTRRLMLKIADAIREKRNGLAIITGESIGQVASQTLESMYTINQVTNTPILRPLVTMDKTEIISISREIDTHDISIRPFEDCCTIFVPASPKTKPKREKVSYYESFVDFEPYMAKAISEVETLIIKPKSNKLSVHEDLF